LCPSVSLSFPVLLSLPKIKLTKYVWLYIYIYIHTSGKIGVIMTVHIHFLNMYDIILVGDNIVMLLN